MKRITATCPVMHKELTVAEHTEIVKIWMLKEITFSYP
jgi:hypothetical protein